MWQEAAAGGLAKIKRDKSNQEKGGDGRQRDAAVLCTETQKTDGVGDGAR